MATNLATDTATFASLIHDLETRFQMLETKGRFLILERLLSLVDEPSDGSKYSPTSSPEYRKDDARKTREYAGTTRKALSSLIGLHQITIFKLEKGILPFNINKKKHRDYLDWLRSHGYKIEAVP